jgi:hypothetical protein
MLLLALATLGQNGVGFGFATVSGPVAGPTPVVVRTTPQSAGAIQSLTWGGKEFIDASDHGRLLQSASGFDAGFPGPFNSECYNPTEAGSLSDGNRPLSSSRLLYQKAAGIELLTVSRPAFWLRPGEQSAGRPALNRTVVSEHLFSKHVRVGMHQNPHALDYRVTFTVPPGEAHRFGQFEALTGYMPPEFGRFWHLLPSGRLAPLDDGPGEQPFPVIFSTADGSHAMGVWGLPDGLAGAPGYGRFRFPRENVVKWNCVYRVQLPGGLPTGEQRFRMIVAVGSLENVRVTLANAR